VGAALRIFQLGGQSLWYDELYTAFIVRRDWGQIVTAVIQSDVHPPLAYLFIHLVAPAGADESALRAVPCLFSILTLPLFYAAAAHWFDRHIAALAALILAFDPFQILFAQEARMYAQLAFFTLASQLFFWRAWQTGRARDWAIFTAATSLTFYTHNLAGLNLLALDVFALIRQQELRDRWRPLLSSHVAVALLFLPWLPAMVQQFTRVSTGFWGSAPSPLSLLTAPYLLLFGNAVPSDLVAVALFAGLALMVFAAFAAIRAVRAGQPEAQSLIFSGAIFCIPVLTLFLLAQVRPIFVERTLIASSFGLIGLLAWAVRRAPARLLMVVLAALAGVAMLAAAPAYYFDPDVQKPHFREAARELAGALEPGDIVVHTSDSSALAFAYYLPGVPAHFLAGDPDFELNSERAVAGRYIGLTPEPLDSLAANHTRLWLVVALDHNEAYQQAQVAVLNQRFGLPATRNIAGIREMSYRIPF
jgi:mannosyltransferase